MSTLLDVVSGSLTAIGQLGQGQTANPEDGALGLRQSNLMLSQKSTQRLFLPYIANRQYALVANQADYSIGQAVGATFNAPRPVFIESAQVIVAGTKIVLPLSILDKERWDAIRNKGAVADVPDSLYPEYQSPNMLFHVNPVTTGTPFINLGAWEQLTQFVTLFDVLAFPPAYEEWLESNLAVVLAPYYDQQVPQSLMMRAQKAEAAVMSINAQGLGGALDDAQRLQSPNLGQPIPTGPAPTGGPQ